MGTRFIEVFDRFFGKITDDMYMEYTPADTFKDLRSLILDAIPGFEFPRKVLSYELDDTILDQPTWGGIGNENGQSEYYQQMDRYWGEIGCEGSSPSEPIVIDLSYFTCELTDEEKNILAILMVCAWL